MGTRGLYGFRKGGVDKTTYNHWDSYPDYLGDAVAKLCTAHTPEQFSSFFDRITLVKEGGKPTPEQIAYCQSRGWCDLTVSTRQAEDLYCLIRNLQGNMGELSKAISGDGEFIMTDSSEFIKDSLFCEYAYIINLDTNNLEFWEGFQRSPQEGNRYGVDCDDHGYYPCRLALTLPLNDTDTMSDAVELMNRACGSD